MSGSLCPCHDEQGQHAWHNCPLHHYQPFFCSLLVEDVYTFNDAEAVWQAEAVKVMQSGEW